MSAMQLSTDGLKSIIKSHYLYRAIDDSGMTLDICLDKKRDSQASYAFLKRLIKQFRERRFLSLINSHHYFTLLDSYDNFFESTIHQTSKYLSNIIEPNHGLIKKRHKLYRFIRTDSLTIKGLETIHSISSLHGPDKNLCLFIFLSLQLNRFFLFYIK